MDRYTFIIQCKYCGEPIEHWDEVDMWTNKYGSLICKNVYPEFRGKFDYMPNHQPNR